MLDWHGVERAAVAMDYLVSHHRLGQHVAGILLATLLAVLLLALRLGGGRARGADWWPRVGLVVSQYPAAGPAAVRAPPGTCCRWREGGGERRTRTVHSAGQRLVADAGVPLLDVGAGGLYLRLSGGKIASGLRAVSHGQREAALSQGFTPWQELRFILLPQGLANAAAIVSRYLNLMKLSSSASSIGCRTGPVGAAD